MKRKTRLIVSIAAGLAAVALVAFYVSSIRAQAQAQQAETMARYGGDLVDVVVASRDIDLGETFDDANVHVEKWVASLLPSDAVTAVRKVEGRKATSRIPKNAVVSPLYYQTTNEAVEIPKGKVAVSVAADAEHAVGGALAKDDYVDVYVSKDGVADRLCGATVIATNASGEGAEGTEIAWATLAVNSENVKDLLAAAAKGTVSLVMPAEVADTQEGGEA